MLDLSLLDAEKTYGPWIIVPKIDAACRDMSDRHYSRRTIGARFFTRPGENIVMRNAEGTAMFVSWRSKYPRKDAYGMAWECTIFRSEGVENYLSSDLIKYALYATTKEWGDFPADGFITYVDPKSVQSENAGFCFEKAGFVRQPKRSSKGYICYKTDMDSLQLVIEEMSTVHYLEWTKQNMSMALNSGEYMEAYEFQEEAERLQQKLTELKKEMKSRKLKAWSSVESPVTKEDLDLITDPYFNWMADPQYFKKKGIEIEGYNLC